MKSYYAHTDPIMFEWESPVEAETNLSLSMLELGVSMNSSEIKNAIPILEIGVEQWMRMRRLYKEDVQVWSKNYPNSDNVYATMGIFRVVIPEYLSRAEYKNGIYTFHTTNANTPEFMAYPFEVASVRNREGEDAIFSIIFKRLAPCYETCTMDGRIELK